MKTIAKIFLVALLAAGTMQAAAFEKVAKSRSAKVTISSEKPITTGYNDLNILIDEKFADAAVKIKVFMPAMPGMPYMDNVAEAKNLGHGKFTTNVNFSMGGTWQIHIFITPKTGKKIRVKTSVNI
ncbi:FixH family protein [Sulfurimonas sp.]|uniref:FixH family protein n=1 Tax=Sulfurimonas sp. TaxID=2022749 RepID=UPI0025DC3451|nr:FixH family protein [Sulfurimonas sp.]